MQTQPLIQRTTLHRNRETRGEAKIIPVQILDVDRSGGTTNNPASLQLPFDDVSPLWGKTWREIGIDAFANHRTQGISGVLGSPFLHRPIALVSESGEKIDPAIFAQPLHALGGDAAEKGCAASPFFCPVLKHAEDASRTSARGRFLTCVGSSPLRKSPPPRNAINSLYPG